MENITENKYMQRIGCRLLDKDDGEERKTKLNQVAEEERRKEQYGGLNGKRLIPLLNSFSTPSQAPLTSYISFINYTVELKQPDLKSHQS